MPDLDRKALADEIERLNERRLTARTFERETARQVLAALCCDNLATILAALRDDAGAEMREPPPGLLMSMAIRHDHAIGMPGYYDRSDPLDIVKTPPGAHARRLESILSSMRQLWEEVTGNGFYKPSLEADYVARRDRILNRALPLRPTSETEGEAS